MRKAFVGVFVGLLVLTAADTTPTGATFLSGKDVQEAIQGVAKNAATRNTVVDQQLRVVDAGKVNVGVGVVYRPSKAKQAAVSHDNLTEVYEILEGSGTLTTGGAIVTDQGAESTQRDSAGPSGPSLRGDKLRGGESRRVGPGDIVVIPAGVGHAFTSIDGTIKYVVVRIDPDKVLPLK
jgi:mannose-6-phosphate isomerase-like protein (cupin superfamily)